MILRIHILGIYEVIVKIFFNSAEHESNFTGQLIYIGK